MAIVTLSEYKAYREIDSGDTQYDSRLSPLIAGVNTEIERYCGRTFALSTYTEKLNGKGTDTVIVSNTPLNSVTSVKLLFGDGTSYTYPSSSYTFEAATGVIRLASDYFLTDIRFSGPEESRLSALPNFPDGLQNIEVVYSGGYSAAPDDLKMAAFRLIDFQSNAIGIRDSVNKKLSPLTEFEFKKAILAPFRRYSV